MTINDKEYEVQDHGEYKTVNVNGVVIYVYENQDVEKAILEQLKNAPKKK